MSVAAKARLEELKKTEAKCLKYIQGATGYQALNYGSMVFGWWAEDSGVDLCIGCSKPDSEVYKIANSLGKGIRPKKTSVGWVINLDGCQLSILRQDIVKDYGKAIAWAKANYDEKQHQEWLVRKKELKTVGRTELERAKFQKYNEVFEKSGGRFRISIPPMVIVPGVRQISPWQA